ncbi:hypothetical protein HDC93_007470 [Streptomyces sp. AK010]|nr:hypothetical protein [Streptomyces sp. AK010]
MSHQPDPRCDIDGDVYVSPRHLASTTGTGDPALAPLLDLGWDLRYDEDSNVYVSAPDRRVRLGYLPEGEDDGLWRINAYKDSARRHGASVSTTASPPSSSRHSPLSSLRRTSRGRTPTSPGRSPASTSTIPFSPSSRS